jgi:hypothetical protein
MKPPLEFGRLAPGNWGVSTCSVYHQPMSAIWLAIPDDDTLTLAVLPVQEVPDPDDDADDPGEEEDEEEEEEEEEEEDADHDDNNSDGYSE